MKLGLLADVRGRLAPLEVALSILDGEGCDRIACLGSTAEGGDEDAAVLRLLRDRGAALLPSAHDAPEVRDGLPAELELGSLSLAHDSPAELPLTETLWLHDSPVPGLLEARQALGSEGLRRGCGDWFEAMAYVAGEGGAAERRLFLHSGRFVAPGEALACCPGSVAMAERWARGGSVLTWDDTTRELVAWRFTLDGPLEARDVRVLVYCEDFEPHRPEAAVLHHVELEVKADADGIVEDVAGFRPDLVLLDYHLAGEASGLDALLALRPGGAALPVPVFTIAGNPADQGSMKDVGALGQLPFTYLKDTFTRLLRELGGAG
jgi:CheY-like chemotaxis protein